MGADPRPAAGVIFPSLSGAREPNAVASTTPHRAIQFAEPPQTHHMLMDAGGLHSTMPGTTARRVPWHQVDTRRMDAEIAEMLRRRFANEPALGEHFVLIATKMGLHVRSWLEGKAARSDQPLSPHIDAELVPCSCNSHVVYRVGGGFVTFGFSADGGLTCRECGCRLDFNLGDSRDHAPVHLASIGEDHEPADEAAHGRRRARRAPAGGSGSNASASTTDTRRSHPRAEAMEAGRADAAQLSNDSISTDPNAAGSSAATLSVERGPAATSDDTSADPELTHIQAANEPNDVNAVTTAAESTPQGAGVAGGLTAGTDACAASSELSAHVSSPSPDATTVSNSSPTASAAAKTMPSTTPAGRSTANPAAATTTSPSSTTASTTLPSHT